MTQIITLIVCAGIIWASAWYVARYSNRQVELNAYRAGVDRGYWFGVCASQDRVRQQINAIYWKGYEHGQHDKEGFLDDAICEHPILN
jgi:hypothetical protein